MHACRVTVRPRLGAEGIQRYPTRNIDGTIRRWWTGPWPVEDEVSAEEVEALIRAPYLDVTMTATCRAQAPTEVTTLPATRIKLTYLATKAPRGVGVVTLKKRAEELGIEIEGGSVTAEDADRLLEV